MILCQESRMMSWQFQGTFELVPILFCSVNQLFRFACPFLFWDTALYQTGASLTLPITVFLFFSPLLFPSSHRKCCQRGRLTGELFPMTHSHGTSSFSRSPPKQRQSWTEISLMKTIDLNGWFELFSRSVWMVQTLKVKLPVVAERVCTSTHVCMCGSKLWTDADGGTRTHVAGFACICTWGQADCDHRSPSDFQSLHQIKAELLSASSRFACVKQIFEPGRLMCV